MRTDMNRGSWSQRWLVYVGEVVEADTPRFRRGVGMGEGGRQEQCGAKECEPDEMIPEPHSRFMLP